MPLYCRNWDECSSFRPRNASNGSALSLTVEDLQRSYDSAVTTLTNSMGGATGAASPAADGEAGLRGEYADVEAADSSPDASPALGAEDIGGAVSGGARAGGFVVAGTVGAKAQQVAAVAITEGLFTLSSLPHTWLAYVTASELLMFLAALASSVLYLAVCHVRLAPPLLGGSLSCAGAMLLTRRTGRDCPIFAADLSVLLCGR